MKKIVPITTEKIHYTLKHPLIQENVLFESWVELCDYVIDVAIREAEKRMDSKLTRLVYSISDEIIETVIEVPDGT